MKDDKNLYTSTHEPHSAPETEPELEKQKPKVASEQKLEAGHTAQADRKPEEDVKSKVNDPELLVGPYKPKENEPPTIKCPNCGEEMPTTIDTCVNCGHYLKKGEKRYQMMDEAKARKIRWTIGIILIVAFIIYMSIKG